jgi:hypothetical protein
MKKTPSSQTGLTMAKKKTKKANRRADKKRKEMAAAVKRNKPIIDKLKRALGQMGKEVN